MANYALLNNVDHIGLRVVTRHSAAFGDNVPSVLTFPTEYADIQREYPIFLRRQSDGSEFYSIALLGFESGENLFLDEHGWAARYVPGIVTRGPFLIGFQEQLIDGQVRKEPVIHIDLDSPRLSRTEGEEIFLEHGGNSPFIEGVSRILERIHAGTALSEAMCKAFDELGLIVPVSIEVEIDSTTKYDLMGLHTISEERIAQLPGSDLEKLNRAGLLRLAFLVTSSIENMKTLISLKRKRRYKRSLA